MKFRVNVLVGGGLIAALIGVPMQPARAIGQTVVTIGFDDGYADQYTARSILAAHGMHATFFVNSGLVGADGYMTWAELRDLNSDGHEIAGHTAYHSDVRKLWGADLLHAICDDRVILFNQGFEPTSFAYPFGSFRHGSERAVHYCGYNSGRGDFGGPETIPPLDPYATRTFDSVESTTSLETIQGYVTQVEDAGGGWVQLVFHRVCDGCDDYSITPENFSALLEWLQLRSANGTVVMTTTQVVGGTVRAPVIPPR